MVAGTDSGNPAERTALRVMLSACSPACPTQPPITSSTRAGSRPFREVMERRTWAISSTGCVPDSAPPGLPLPDAIRTTSTITALVIFVPFEDVHCWGGPAPEFRGAGYRTEIEGAP